MGKSSVFAAWERSYFAGTETPTLAAAARRHGFTLITLPVRRYAGLPAPNANQPESWVVEAVRLRLGEFGLVTRDFGLVEAMLKTGHIALAIDGTNEADRDAALSAFARQYRQTRLLVTSQAFPPTDPWDKAEEHWEVWRLPDTITTLRRQLLQLWLGDNAGALLADRIEAEGLSETIVSGYDLRLLADLAGDEPAHAPLPQDRIALYEAILARPRASDGEPLRLDNLDQLAWRMVTQRQRRITIDETRRLGDGLVRSLAAEGVRVIRQVGPDYEFRHDQMRAFLAARWLVIEMPTSAALKKAIEEADSFNTINRRDQEELWRFVAPMLTPDRELVEMWNFAMDDIGNRRFLADALTIEAGKRGITLLRPPQGLIIAA